MKTNMSLAMAAFLVTATHAAPKVMRPVDFTVHVYVVLEASTSLLLLNPAEHYATALLADAGVKLVWHRGAAGAEAVGTNFLQIKFIPHAPAHYQDGASSFQVLAFATPYSEDGTRIQVFDDRLRDFVAPHGPRAPIVAGHVLAHEICHVLEGIARHSDSGLMRAKWSATDMAVMTSFGLPLAPEDCALIRAGLAGGTRK